MPTNKTIHIDTKYIDGHILQAAAWSMRKREFISKEEYFKLYYSTHVPIQTEIVDQTVE